MQVEALTHHSALARHGPLQRNCFSAGTARRLFFCQAVADCPTVDPCRAHRELNAFEVIVPNSRRNGNVPQDPMYYWQRDPVFGILCNIIFNVRLVCFTGAGISRNICRKSDSTKALPSWWQLLDELRHTFPPNRPEDQHEIEVLLNTDAAPGDRLISSNGGRDFTHLR